MKDVKFSITLMYTSDDYVEHIVEAKATGETPEEALANAEAELGKLGRFLQHKKDEAKNVISE